MPANRTAHFIWFGPPPKKWLLECVETFKRHHPAWDVQWWGHDDVLKLGMHNEAHYTNAHKIVAKDSVHQFRSDLARLEILQRHGGLYIDLDFHWQRPIDPLINALPPNWLATAWEKQKQHVANGIIYTHKPGHPGITQAINAVDEWVAKPCKTKPRANRVTGPSGLWTNVIRKRRDVTIWAQGRFCPIPWTNPEWFRERSYPGATAIHVWHNQHTLRRL